MIDAILYRLGLVTVSRAQHWVEAAHADCTARAAKALRLEREAARQAYSRGKLAGRLDDRTASMAQFRAEVQAEVARKSGELEAERNGLQARLGLAERKLKLANRRLTARGQVPVINFLCPDYK